MQQRDIPPVIVYATDGLLIQHRPHLTGHAPAVYELLNRQDGDLLGLIQWDVRLREYVLLARPETAWSARRLGQVAVFLHQLLRKTPPGRS